MCDFLQQVKMSTKNWRQKIDVMEMDLNRQFMMMLKKIANHFETTGEEFDEQFRNEFFELINSA